MGIYHCGMTMSGIDGSIAPKRNTLCCIGNNTKDNQHVSHGRDEWVHLNLAAASDTGKAGAENNTGNQSHDDSDRNRNTSKVKREAKDLTSEAAHEKRTKTRCA